MTEAADAQDVALGICGETCGVILDPEPPDLATSIKNRNVYAIFALWGHMGLYMSGNVLYSITA